MRFISLLNNQLLIDACLGVIMALFFFEEFATMDTDYKKREKTVFQKSFREISLIVFIITVVSMVALFIMRWNEIEIEIDIYSFAEDYKMLAFYVFVLFTITALTGYIWKFESSPRSPFVKVRKCIGYILLIGFYYSHVMRSVTYDYIYIISENGYTIPMLLGESSVLIIVWLLVRHYKQDKYISVLDTDISLSDDNSNMALSSNKSKNTQINKRKILAISSIIYEFILVVVISVITIVQYNDVYVYYDISIPIIIGLLLSIPPVIILFVYRSYLMSRISTLLDNRKKILALYLSHELILFICLIIWIIVQVNSNKPQLGIPLLIFISLSIVPIGLFWIIKLFRESKDNNN